MKLLGLVPLLAMGCVATEPAPTSTGVQLGEPGRLALAGDCVVVAEHASIVCVPRASADDGRAYALVKSSDRTYVAIAATADGDAVLATSTAGGRVYLDRVALDGTVTPIAAAAATAGAGGFAIADKQVVLSTGSALVLVDAGGNLAPLADATGVIGSVAVRAGTAYYTDDASLREITLAGEDMSPYPGLVTIAVAADASAVALAQRLHGDGSYSFVENPTTGDTCELHGTASRIVLAGGHPFAISDGAIYDATDVVAEQPVVATRDAFDLAVDEQAIYWITRGGELDRAPRP